MEVSNEMGIALRYIGEGKTYALVPARDMTALEAERYAREYGGVEVLLESGLYEKADTKPARSTAKSDDEKDG